MNMVSLIDPALYEGILKEALPQEIETIFLKKFGGVNYLCEKIGDDMIPFTPDYFAIYKHPKSAYTVNIDETHKNTCVYPQDGEKVTKFPLDGAFGTTSHNVLAVEAHQTFLMVLRDYVFGLKKLKKKFFYHSSRCLYDIIKWVYILHGIDKTLVPYFKDGYKTKEKRFLRCRGREDIRVVWDHWNYPEPYFKKLLIFCIKYRVWPSFDIFLQEAFYPTGKCVILSKKTHDKLGSSNDSDRNTKYQDAGIEICEAVAPYKDIPNNNIWTSKKQKHLDTGGLTEWLT